MPNPVLALVALYRDAFGGLPRLTWLLCAAAFLNRMGSMVVPFLGPWLKRDFGHSPSEAGLVIACYGIGAFGGSWIGGKLTDRIGPVRLQVLALGSSALWMLLLTQLHTAELVMPAIFVLGVLNDAFRPGSNTAAAVSAPPELRRKALSLNRFALNLGWAFGPTIGGYLVVHDFTWMFVVDGTTCAIAAAWLWFSLRDWRPPIAVAPASEPGAGTTRRPASPLRDAHLQGLMLANLCVLLAFMQYFTTGPRVFRDQGHPESTIGWLLAINPILIVLCEMPLVHALQRRRALPMIALGSAIIGVGYLAMLVPPPLFGVVLAMVVVAGGELLQMPMLGSHINDIAPDHARGAYNGAYGMNFTLALVLAPLLGGYAYEYGGATLLWYLCAGLGLLGAVGFLLLEKRGRR